MPLSALVDGVKVNALTVADTDWETIHLPARLRAVEIRCAAPACRARMYPQVRVYPAPIGELRCFAHWPGETTGAGCAGESAGHLELKAQVARSAASAGWDVEVEVRFAGGVCDVVATLAGRAHAFEAQLSPQGVAQAVERTSRYAAEYGSVTWLHPGAVPWRRMVPALQLGEVDDGMSIFAIVGGVYALDGSADDGILPPHPLDLAVPRLLDGRYVWLPSERRDDTGTYGMHWDRLAGGDETEARNRVRKRAGSRPDKATKDRRRDVCDRTDTDLSEQQEIGWASGDDVPPGMWVHYDATAKRYVPSPPRESWGRPVPNLPGLPHIAPAIDRSTWPADVLASVEAAEARMRAAVNIARRDKERPAREEPYR
jgi:hypothetical protein